MLRSTQFSEQSVCGTDDANRLQYNQYIDDMESQEVRMLYRVSRLSTGRPVGVAVTARSLTLELNPIIVNEDLFRYKQMRQKDLCIA